MTSLKLHREGAFRLGGLVYGWWSLGDPALAAWRFVSPEALGEPDAGHVVLGDDFLTLAASRSDDDDVQVLSPWSVFQPEFDWPIESRGCGCLERNGFPEIVRELNGDELVPSPGPVSDRFLMKVAVLEALGHRAKLSAEAEIAFNVWATVVGVDHSYIAAGIADLSEPGGSMRKSSQTLQTGEAHEAYLRAFDAYYYGGLPARLGRVSKTVYLDTLESRLGYSYVPAENSVLRTVSTINSLRLTKQLCCTSIEYRGTKVFASPLERVAEATAAG